MKIIILCLIINQAPCSLTLTFITVPCYTKGKATKIKYLKRQAILRWEELMEEHKHVEPIVIDGIESFIRNQYCPNNVNNAVGKHSLFTYHVNYSALNRKGRKTATQEIKNRLFHLQKGKFPTNSIYKEFTNCAAYIVSKSKQLPVELHTDEKKEYKWSLDRNFKGKFVHHTTNSKIKRDVHNNLFAVNNLDMQLRHYLACCKRETIAFSKQEAGFMDRIILFSANRNFMRPKFVRGSKDDPFRHKRSPAMEIGVTNSILTFNQFFDRRRMSTQVKIRKDWKSVFFDDYPFAKFPIIKYQGI